MITRILLFVFLGINYCCFAQPPRLVIPEGHLEPVTKIAISPDEKMLASIEGIRCFIWDLKSGKLLFNLGGHANDIKDVCFSPDGKWLATAGYDETIKIWDVKRGKQEYELKGHTDIIHSIAFSPDGKMLVSGGDFTVKLWNPLTGQLLKNLPVHRSYVTRALFSHDGKYVIAGSDDSTISITTTGSFRTRYLNGHPDYLREIEISANDKYIVSTDVSGDCMAWDFISGSILLKTDHKKDGYIGTIKISPGNELFLAGTSTSKIIAYELPGSGSLFDLALPIKYDSRQMGYRTGIRDISFSKLNKTVAISGNDSIVCLVDRTSGKNLAIIAGEDQLSGLAHLERTNNLITAGTQIKLRNALSGNELLSMQNHINTISLHSLSENGEELIAESGNFFNWKLSSAIEEKMDGGFSTTGNTHAIILSARLDTLGILDRGSNKRISIIPKPGAEILFTQLSNDYKFSLISYKKGSPVLFNNTTLEGVALESSERAWDVKAFFSADDKLICSYGWDKRIRVWKRDNLEEIVNEFLPVIYYQSAKISPDNKYLGTVAGDTLRIFAIDSGNWVKKIPCISRYNFDLYFTSDSRAIILSPNDADIRAFDINSGKELYKIEGKLINIAPGNSIDYIANGLMDNLVRIHDAKTGKLISVLKGHHNLSSQALINTAKKIVITRSFDYNVRVWKLDGSLVQSIYWIDSNPIVITPAGYYKASPAPAKQLHYVSPDLQIITFDQLDIKFNRPDKVLEEIGSRDTILINSYRKAWEKRIRKLGVDTAAFNNGFDVPVTEILNKEEIAFVQDLPALNLVIRAGNKTGNLDRFNIWINESPLYGQKGISLRSMKTRNWDTTITIQLSEGINLVESSTFNSNGIESFRMPLAVNYESSKKTEQKVYFIGLGIEKFRDENYNLQYSVKDIRDLSGSLSKRYKDTIIAHLLLEKELSRENIIEIKRALLKTSVNDKVIVAYSGHGLLSKDFDYFLSTFNVDFEDPLKEGLPYEELENLLDSIPARHKLLLIDACHSGEVDKEEMTRLNEVADTLQLKKGLKPVAFKQDKGNLGMKNSFELMKDLFVNVGRSTGATVISAAAGTQFALERGDLKNGVFTFSILEAMKKYPTMKISQLKIIVGERVWQLTNGLQKPTSRNETIAADWNIW